MRTLNDRLLSHGHYWFVSALFWAGLAYCGPTSAQQDSPLPGMDKVQRILSELQETADRIGDDDLTPTVVGPGYDVREAAQPLADFGARDLVTVVSGLTIPWRTGSAVPPGGREAETVLEQHRRLNDEAAPYRQIERDARAIWRDARIDVATRRRAERLLTTLPIHPHKCVVRRGAAGAVNERTVFRESELRISNP